MARHSISEPRIRRLIEPLVDLVLYQGSVRSAHAVITTSLAASGRKGVLYPNRLYAILSSDVTVGVNTATVELLEGALSSLEIPASGGERDRLRTVILQTYGQLSGLQAATPDAVRRVAEDSGMPPAVVETVLRGAGCLALAAPSQSTAPDTRSRSADWSFQEVAVRDCIASLRKAPTRKVALVVPTGGGKTRIATQIAVRWLTELQRDETVVLWVTHRLQLREQARRELQRSLKGDEHGLSIEATGVFEKRIVFTMISELEDRLLELGDHIALVIVDEAHHAAAPSYAPLFAVRPLRGLFLTATPNRADDLPIGIDEIAFSITYRELFERGVIMEPVFDEPVTMDGLQWNDADRLRDLADFLLERTEAGLQKALVAVSRTDHAENLYETLQSALDERVGHVLAPGDIGFVHASRNSAGVSALEFLDEFASRPRGILIATSQLISEGFDDPQVDGIVITYPSTSISHLMQAAGRALRSTPGKTEAHVIQVRSSPLAYHYEQRWLYQDISDSLRPQLIDRAYASADTLRAEVDRLLAEYHVDTSVSTRIRLQLEQAAEGKRYNLILTGLPYFGARSEFATAAPWGAVLVVDDNRQQFLRVFNDFADRHANVNDHRDFLSNYLTPDATRGSEWKSYMDMLAAMAYARMEIERAPYEGERNRNYEARYGTSWLTYVTFEYRPALPMGLAAFLGDAVNRDEIARRYLSEPTHWHLAIKIPLPLAGTLAFILSDEQATWLSKHRAALIRRLADAPATDGFALVGRWRTELQYSPLPMLLLDEVEHLISEQRFGSCTLPLRGTSAYAPSADRADARIAQQRPGD